MTFFKIALAQYPVKQHADLDTWKQYVENWVLLAVKDNAKILIFPEYGSIELVSLFSKDIQNNLKDQINELSSLLEEFKNLYSQQAKKNNIYILAPSIPVKINEKFINRAYFFNPKGEVAYQDKLSMTRFEDEDWRISSGKPELFVFETEVGKIGINICFDSEFPQYAFELAQAGIELLLVPSCTETAWGLARIHIGSRARALENQMYVAVSSTVGDSPWSAAVDYNTGQAGLFAPADLGFPVDGIVELGKLNEAAWVIAEVELSKIQVVRESGNVFNFKKSIDTMSNNPKIRVVKIKF